METNHWTTLFDIMYGPMPSWALNFIAGAYAAATFFMAFLVFRIDYGYGSITSLIIAIVLAVFMAPATRYVVQLIQRP
jgi:hypothetical protein